MSPFLCACMAFSRRASYCFRIFLVGLLLKSPNIVKVLKRETVENLIKDPKRKELDRTMRQSLYAKMDVRKYPERYVSLCCRCLIEGKISRGVFAPAISYNNGILYLVRP